VKYLDSFVNKVLNMVCITSARAVDNSDIVNEGMMIFQDTCKRSLLYSAFTLLSHQAYPQSMIAALQGSLVTRQQINI